MSLLFTYLDTVNENVVSKTMNMPSNAAQTRNDNGMLDNNCVLDVMAKSDHKIRFWFDII